MNKRNALAAKMSEFSSLIEQNLEEVLNELISNNYKLRNLNLDVLLNNGINKIYDEINELSISVLTSFKNKYGINKICRLHKKQKNIPENLIREVIGAAKFANNLRNINNSIILIKHNINELYKYPVFKKQAHIPDFTLMVSSFFKENIDLFFQNNNDINTKNRLFAELKKIIFLSHKMLNEFSQDIPDGNIDANSNENQVIYYSNIISYLELIAINTFSLHSLANFKK